MWQVYKRRGLSHFITGANGKKSNWMRYVKCARIKDQQNVTAYQFQGNIYYKTLRRIERGEELLVWYGDQYGVRLGLVQPVKQSGKPDQQPGEIFYIYYTYSTCSINENNV